MPSTEIQDNKDLKVDEEIVKDDKVKEIESNSELVTTTEHKEKMVDSKNNENQKEDEVISESIEEPVMIVTGEGNGADCESSSFFIGEEIVEPVMYVWGEGNGFENNTGNPDNNDDCGVPERKLEENNSNDLINYANGECTSNTSSNGDTNDKEKIRTLKKAKKDILQTSSPSSSVSKRSLKKQSDNLTDNIEDENDSKKHCVRNVCNDNLCDNSSKSKCTRLQEHVSEDSELIHKNPISSNKASTIEKETNKGTAKVKLKKQSEKNNILEKRKSSVSSSDHEEGTSPDKSDVSIDSSNAINAPDTLPPKKLKLENSIDENDLSEKQQDLEIKDNNTLTNIENNELASKCDNLEYIVNKSSNISNHENSDDKQTINVVDGVSNRKKLKIVRNKFRKHKIILKDTPTETTHSDNENSVNNCDTNSKMGSKALKRSLLDSNKREKSQSESVSEEIEDEEMGGKRPKLKSKKSILASRKKKEAEIEKNSTSEESDNETLQAIGNQFKLV